MDSKTLFETGGQLEAMITQRQLALWEQIVRTYEIEPSMNTQIRTWILQGILSEKSRK